MTNKTDYKRTNSINEHIEEWDWCIEEARETFKGKKGTQTITNKLALTDMIELTKQVQIWNVCHPDSKRLPAYKSKKTNTYTILTGEITLEDKTLQIDVFQKVPHINLAREEEYRVITDPHAGSILGMYKTNYGIIVFEKKKKEDKFNYKLISELESGYQEEREMLGQLYDQIEKKCEQSTANIQH